MRKFILTSSCLILSLLARNAGAVTSYYWDNNGTSAATSGTWDTTSTLWTTSTTLTASTVAYINGSFPRFSAGTATTALTITVNSPVTCAGMYAQTSSAVTFSGTGSIGIVSGLQGFLCGGNITCNVPLTGSGEIDQQVGGFLALNANNTYSGGTQVTGGQVTYYYNNNSFGTGPIIVAGSGQALVNGGSAALTIPNNFSFPTAGYQINLAGGNSVAGAPGTTFSGNFPLPSGTTTIETSSTATEVTEISGIVSGSMATLTVSDAGTLILGGNNTYADGTVILSGVVSVSADNNLGTASSTANLNITLSGGTLNAGNTFTLNPKRLISLTANSGISVSTGKTLTYAGAITGSAALSKTGAGTLALAGANGYTGTTTISSGTLEADSQSGSSVGANSVLLSPGATLSGSGIVSGAVSGAGNVAPGTPAGPATLTLGNGLNLSSGGTYVWSLSANSTSGNFPVISLIGGNLALGGTSKLSIGFNGTASAPATNNPFWQTQEAWTVISASGSAGDTGMTQFTTLLNGSYAAGNFTNYVNGNGNIVLLYKPNFAVFDALYDSGPGFFSGENLIFTNFSGLALFAWASTNASLSVSNWTLVGPMEEQPLAPELPGYSRYSMNVVPTVSPTYYVAGNTNAGPYIYSPVPASILTTPDFSTFTVINTNVAITASGVLALQPAPPVILPGSSYSSGQFQLQFSSAAYELNYGFSIQGSTNLSTWTNISSGTISSSPMTFTDPAATLYSNQFYRVVLP